MLEVGCQNPDDIVISILICRSCNLDRTTFQCDLYNLLNVKFLICSPQEKHLSIGVKLDNFKAIYKLSYKYFKIGFLLMSMIPQTKKQLTHTRPLII